MQKPFYSIAEKTAEILIYGVIGGEGNSAKQFVTDFQALEASADTIHVRINSPGGSVWDGLPIFNAMCASQKKVYTYDDGIAGSMGGMFLLAGHRAHMAQGSLLMLHNVSGGEFGNAQTLRKTADTLDKYDDLFAKLIAARTNKTIDFVKTNWLNFEDNYFSPEEAKAAGLIDVIESYPAKNIPQNIKSLNHYQIAAFYQAQQAEQPEKNTLTKTKPIMNKFLKLMTIGIKAEGDNEAATEVVETENEDLKQQLDALKTENEDLKQQNETLKAENKNLQEQLNAVSTPPSTPIAPADVIHNSGSRPTFETSFDREAMYAFRDRY